MSKIDAGALTLEHLPYSLFGVVYETAQLLQTQIKEKPVILEVDYTDNAPHFVWGDPGRMRQIITNLISNSIKFTFRGHVRLSLHMIHKDNNQPWLRIAIEDTGIGIPADKLETVFEKFSQADTSVTRKFGGTGLGLTITRQLVRLMGGEIHVESVEGKGSTFWFTVPLQIATPEAVAAEQSTRTGMYPQTIIRRDLSTLRALLVEDYPMNQTFAIKLLTKMGITQLDLAENGLIALDMHTSAPYDVIFMDIQMPELDGIETTKAIYQEWGKTNRPYIIAMTANVMQSNRDECLSVGMDDFIPKPVKLEAIVESIQLVQKRLFQHRIYQSESTD
jgi:CheY-like chemotaxis protein